MAGRESTEARRTRAERIGRALARLYPQARISLDFESPWQCLAATILSAQCTDERVNQVTPVLFREFPDAGATARAPEGRIRELVASTGFFRQKTRSLIGTARMLVERHGAEVPRSMEELIALAGVGRKTANVVRGHVFGEPGFVVDTHVRRLTRRLGLTGQYDPDRIERDLCAILPKARWTSFSMRLILHGRRVCTARAPQCGVCRLAVDCPQMGVKPRAASRSR
jgi:endonuclease-3